MIPLALRAALLSFCIALGACSGQPGSAGDESPESKREYSILQSLELEYRATTHVNGVRIVFNALGTKRVALGLPIAGQADGYTWFMASTHDGRVRGGVPDVPFWIRPQALEDIRKHVKLDPAMSDLLDKHVKDSP